MSKTNIAPVIETKPLSMTVNGEKIGPIDVPIDIMMIDFLHEYLDLTGTHFGCGQGICHACTIVELQDDGNIIESRTCIYGAHFFNGKNIIGGLVIKDNGKFKYYQQPQYKQYDKSPDSWEDFDKLLE